MQQRYEYHGVEELDDTARWAKRKRGKKVKEVVVVATPETSANISTEVVTISDNHSLSTNPLVTNRIETTSLSSRSIAAGVDASKNGPAPTRAVTSGWPVRVVRYTQPDPGELSPWAETIARHWMGHDTWYARFLLQLTPRAREAADAVVFRAAAATLDSSNGQHTWCDHNFVPWWNAWRDHPDSSYVLLAAELQHLGGITSFGSNVVRKFDLLRLAFNRGWDDGYATHESQWDQTQDKEDAYWPNVEAGGRCPLCRCPTPPAGDGSVIACA